MWLRNLALIFTFSTSSKHSFIGISQTDLISLEEAARLLLGDAHNSSITRSDYLYIVFTLDCNSW